MDEIRRIRFLTPLLFVTSLLWAMWLDPNPHWRHLAKHVLRLPKDNSVIGLLLLHRSDSSDGPDVFQFNHQRVAALRRNTAFDE
jgi:hypothetical protein